MDAKLHAVDADTGQPCADFGQGGVLDFNRFNTTDARWPLSLLQPPTVFGDTLFLGWAGKDWAEAVDSPGSVYALDARTGAVKWTFDTLPPDAPGQDRHRQRLGLDVGRPRAPPPLHPGLLARAPTSSRAPSRSTSPSSPPSPRSTPTPARWSGPASSSTTTSGTTTPTPPRPSSTSRRTAAPSPPWSRPRSRASSTSSTAPPASPSTRSRSARSRRPTCPGELSAATQPFVALPERVVPDRWPGVFKLADFLSGGWCSRTAAGLRDEGSFTPAEPRRQPRLPRHRRRRRMGRRRRRPALRHLRRQLLLASSQIYRLIPRADYDAAAGAPARPAASRR